MQQNWSQDVYVKAWDYATAAHRGQTYGGPLEGQRVDYINHIGSVAMEVIWALCADAECDGNLAIQCALLHDTIEDTASTFAEITAVFGLAVARGVQALTKNNALPSKQEQMLDSLARIKQQPPEIGMVKLADRITNLSEPPFYWDNEKRIRYRKEAQLIYEELHPSSQQLAARLAAKIESYKQYIV